MRNREFTLNVQIYCNPTKNCFEQILVEITVGDFRDMSQIILLAENQKVRRARRQILFLSFIIKKKPIPISEGL